MSTHLTDRPLEALPLLSAVSAPECGATVVFLGTVRSSPEDGDVVAIDYSAYPEMADKEFDGILADAAARWPQARFALRHRIGLIPVGEASIAVAVACPHRAEAYEASRFVIDQVKKRVPIWKKERFASGEARWVEGSNV